ncbi:restriction endonuclease subunit S, partial [Lacticaseibacillus paracasei]|uniref:restriction endonuclease subunit S n=1 Tax=Lacticaseibacillus paracasei TaxID=1597 RepID=UPI000A4FDB56
LIAATQRRIDALEQAKKALLQRLFDQSWRFKGYSDPWEKRKFKDLVVRINKTSDDSMIPSVEFEDIISKQGRLNKDVRLKINSKQGIYFEPQDVLFGKLRPYLQNWLFPSFYGRAVGDFWVLRANSSLLSEYLFVLIQSPRFQSVANISAGTKMPRSDWNTVSNTSFSIPVQSEQRRIGQLFNVLDDLIAATQSRLSSLELLKKALLQDLFI